MSALSATGSSAISSGTKASPRLTQAYFAFGLRHVKRRVYAEVPPRVEYSLTGLGMSPKPILDAMQSWGEGYKAMLAEGEDARG